MNVSIIAVGSIKEHFYKDALAEYVKRLSRYCKFEIIEVKDEKTPDKSSYAEEKKIKDTEGERILSKFKDSTYMVALAIDGKKVSSIDLSELMSDWEIKSRGNLCFVIGGSLGLSEAVIKRADYKLSFSEMTFPHQLMRVILVEQIYRSYRIKNNEPYHK